MNLAAIRNGRPALETKLLADPGLLVSPTGEFDGYASLFGVPDLGGDLVVRGAFAESLVRRGPSGVKMLWQHDSGEPLGRWLDLVEDERGLRVRGRLSPHVGRAREVAALMADGAVDGLSIGFRVVEGARDRARGLRRLVKLDLWEVSIVTFPMLPGARIVASTTPRLAAPPGPPPTPLGLAIRRATARLYLTPAPRIR